ncbi:hypothetical protein [Cohnella sp.]
MIKTFIPEALKRGRREGKKEGLQEGKKLGVQQAKTEVAGNLLQLGVDIDTIAGATGLSPDEIAKIKP